MATHNSDFQYFVVVEHLMSNSDKSERYTGVVRPDESPVEAAARVLHEQTGIKIEPDWMNLPLTNVKYGDDNKVSIYTYRSTD